MSWPNMPEDPLEEGISFDEIPVDQIFPLWYERSGEEAAPIQENSSESAPFENNPECMEVNIQSIIESGTSRNVESRHQIEENAPLSSSATLPPQVEGTQRVENNLYSEILVNIDPSPNPIMEKDNITESNDPSSLPAAAVEGTSGETQLLYDFSDIGGYNNFSLGSFIFDSNAEENVTHRTESNDLSSLPRAGDASLGSRVADRCEGPFMGYSPGYNDHSDLAALNTPLVGTPNFDYPLEPHLEGNHNRRDNSTSHPAAGAPSMVISDSLTDPDIINLSAEGIAIQNPNSDNSHDLISSSATKRNSAVNTRRPPRN